VTHPPSKQRRSVDQGPLRGLRAWWERWGDLITAVWLFAVTVVLLWVAIGFKHSQSATATAAKVNCQRSRVYGPGLADFLEREHAFPPPVLDKYRLTIPKVCPGDPGR
jgi:hypothetical protein